LPGIINEEYNKTKSQVKYYIKQIHGDIILFSFFSNTKKDKIAHDLAVVLAAKTCDSSVAADLLEHYRTHYEKLTKEIDDINFDEEEELVRPC
jgi:hypothetical protein